jgi:hypothetical protein
MEPEITNEINDINNNEDVPTGDNAKENIDNDNKNENLDKNESADNDNVDNDNAMRKNDILSNQPEPVSEIQMSRRDFLERVQNLYNDIEVQEERIREILREKEDLEIASYEQGLIQDDENQYPSILNPQFNSLIAKKKEFADTIYPDEIKNIEEESKKLCDQEFELAPYQIFVRNFISNQTPYNGLLLFHGVGTGKTCASISICENLRDYQKQLNIYKKTVIVASKSVQHNFRKQLFDENKLIEIDGMWSMKQNCIGSKLLKEMNPLYLKGYTKEMVVKEVNQIINDNYEFIGYKKLSNAVDKIIKRFSHIEDKKQRVEYIKKSIAKEYSGKIFVIDEVHNIRISESNQNKMIMANVMRILTYSQQIKLVLLSATPMFNSHKEIVLLLNLLNTNDNRPIVQVNDIFTKDGLFVTDDDGNEIGKERLIQKSRGYVSYVRGENIYTFPYRIFPKQFDEDYSNFGSNFVVPTEQLNKIQIVQNIQFMDLFMVGIGDYQLKCYEYIKQKVLEQFPDKEDIEVGIGWQFVNPLIQCLNMTYPNEDIYSEAFNENNAEIDIRDIIGAKGLDSIMIRDEEQTKTALKKRKKYRYTKECLRDYGRIFEINNISNYSMKIYNILKRIQQSTGIVLVFSQFLDSGCIPVALALEECGYRAFNQSTSDGTSNNLFAKSKDLIDVFSQKTRAEHEKTEVNPFYPATYALLTGDKNITKNLEKLMETITDENNKDGKYIKVIIISGSGSEGIDFKYLRQVHIMDPWYNNKRNEQIIGRAVRYCSHSLLDFSQRNVEIYMYATTLKKKEEESIDMFIYRLAEKKSLKIGEVTRLLKSTAVDCLMTKSLSDMSEERVNQTVNIELSSGKTIAYKIGDKPYSELCDYMEKCTFTCIPELSEEEMGTNNETHDIKHVEYTIDNIIKKIKELYKTYYVLKKTELIKEISYDREYSKEQFNMALDTIIKDKNEYLVDMFGRLGRLRNQGTLYYYQPLELKGRSTIFDIEKPVDFKHQQIVIEKDQIKKNLDSKAKTLSRTIKKNERDDPETLIRKVKVEYEGVKTPKKIPTGNKDWFLNSANAIERLHTRMSTVEKQTLYRYVVHHSYDKLLSEKKKDIIEYIIRKQPELYDEYEKYLREYIDKYIGIQEGNDTYYRILNDINEVDYYGFHEDLLMNLNMYKPRTLIELQAQDAEKTNRTLNTIVGFMYPFSDYGETVFKTKNITKTRNKGAMCSQKPKSEVVEMMNQIVTGNAKQNIYDLKALKSIKGYNVCCELELMLRHLNEIEDKVYYLNPEWTRLYNIDNK